MSTSTVFQEIVKNIEHDSNTSTAEAYITIIEKTDKYISVFDALDSEEYAQEYTIYNPAYMDENYFRSILLFSDDIKNNKNIFPIDENAILHYLTNDVDKTMLMTVKNIAFVTNEEEYDTDSIFRNTDIADGI